ncbi:ATP-binding protein [uncultured Dialister sp.]|uniref:ATP-binding protein n=1 Tax=uncultured Dialister sp. TaxID=278064 RepID=UPI00260FCCCB|nr:ATP-binding protein [uncultured Dialister sp.]
MQTRKRFCFTFSAVKASAPSPERPRFSATRFLRLSRHIKFNGLIPALYQHCLMKHFAGSYFVIKLILFCSQFAYEGWHQQLAGGAVADAILDRIIPGSYKLEIQGSVSMRQRITESEEKNESKTKA